MQYLGEYGPQPGSDAEYQAGSMEAAEFNLEAEGIDIDSLVEKFGRDNGALKIGETKIDEISPDNAANSYKTFAELGLETTKDGSEEAEVYEKLKALK